MCDCNCRIHWSVVAILVSVMAVSLYTSAVATNKWAKESFTDPISHDVNLGLFRSCTELNDTCTNTHVFFHGVKQKGTLMASAIIHVFALIGMWFFLAMSVMYLCGLFDDDQLVNVSILMSFASAFLSVLGILMYLGCVIPLGYSLNWSTLLAAAGCLVNVAAGMLMCIGQKRGKKKPKKKKPNRNSQVEELQMKETNRGENAVWSTPGQYMSI